MERETETRAAKRNAVLSCLSCSICGDVLNEATTISVCLHTFCKSCITKKIQEENFSNCPQCDTYLGGDPMEKLRVDNNLQIIRETILPSDTYAQKVRVIPKLLSQSNFNGDPKSKLTAEHPNELMCVVKDATEKQSSKQLTSSGAKKIENSDLGDNQKPSDVLKTGQGVAFRPCSRGPGGIWLSLTSSSEQIGSPPLPQIPLPYLNTKNGDTPVWIIKKYLVKKLHLSSEAEVEIFLTDQVMGDNCLLKDLLEFWLQTRPLGRRIGEDSAKDAVMPLVYSRKA